MGEIFTAAGTKVFIAPAQAAEPANATAYAALTWTEIKLVENAGEYGDEAGAVTFASLGDSRTRKGKSARDAGTMTLVCGYDGTDPGQAAMEAAEKTNSNYPFKVSLPNRLTPGGTDEINYFTGLVMSRRKNVGTNDNVVRRTYAVAINSGITEVPAA
jgi:hypothetical protein